MNDTHFTNPWQEGKNPWFPGEKPVETAKNARLKAAMGERSEEEFRRKLLSQRRELGEILRDAPARLRRFEEAARELARLEALPPDLRPRVVRLRRQMALRETEISLCRQLRQTKEAQVFAGERCPGCGQVLPEGLLAKERKRFETKRARELDYLTNRLGQLEALQAQDAQIIKELEAAPIPELSLRERSERMERCRKELRKKEEFLKRIRTAEEGLAQVEALLALTEHKTERTE